LLRFSDAAADTTRGAERFRASIIVDDRGRVLVPGTPVNSPSGSKDDGAFPGRLQPKRWHAVTVQVDSTAGEVLTYVDTRPCAVARGVDAHVLRLRGRLMVFGGGRQTEARGGSLRRIQVDSVVLDEEMQLKPLAWAAWADIAPHRLALARAQARIRGRRHARWLPALLIDPHLAPLTFAERAATLERGLSRALTAREVGSTTGDAAPKEKRPLLPGTLEEALAKLDWNHPAKRSAAAAQLARALDEEHPDEEAEELAKLFKMDDDDDAAQEEGDQNDDSHRKGSQQKKSAGKKGKPRRK